MLFIIKKLYEKDEKTCIILLYPARFHDCLKFLGTKLEYEATIVEGVILENERCFETRKLGGETRCITAGVLSTDSHVYKWQTSKLKMFSQSSFSDLMTEKP